jgi:hypothetical protein
MTANPPFQHDQNTASSAGAEGTSERDHRDADQLPLFRPARKMPLQYRNEQVQYYRALRDHSRAMMDKRGHFFNVQGRETLKIRLEYTQPQAL